MMMQPQPSGVRNQAYTLIEILIVLVIMSIVAGAALLTIHPNKSRQVAMTVEDMVAAMKMIQEEAMLKPAILGLSIQNHQWVICEYQEKQGHAIWLRWHDAHHLQPHYWPLWVVIDVSQAEWTIKAAGATDQETQPMLVFSSDGEVTPFRWRIGEAEQLPLYEIRGEVGGEISSRRLA